MVRDRVFWSKVLVLLCLAAIAGCQTTVEESTGGETKRKRATPPPSEAKAEPAPPKQTAPKASTSPVPGAAEGQPEKSPKVKYNKQLDEQFEAVFEQARKGKWEEAELLASHMYEADPEDASVRRLTEWVTKQRQFRREQAVEDEIRRIDAKNSVFNPTIPSLLKENKDRGLPARKDVRDAVQKLENAPYIPDNFGKTVVKQGELFDFETAPGRMSQVLDKEVSVILDKVTLEDIIFNLGQSAGVNFVADKSLPAFKQTLSLNLANVKLSEFLRYVARNLEVQFQVGEDLIWIVDAKDPKKVQEETRFFRLRRGFVVPAAFGATEITQVRTTTPQNVTTVTETQKIQRFVNDNTPPAPAIENAIKEFFTGSKYYIDFERNVIVARGTREQLEVMAEIVKEFDRPIQQVLIEARFITVTKAAFMQLGVIWETGRQLLATSGGVTPTDYTGMAYQLGDNIGLGLQETFTNILGRSTLSATLTALEQSGESQTLSAPRLTLINNRPGQIHDGKLQYYYEEYQVKQQILERRSTSSFVPAGKPTKLTSGVTLEVLASIGGDGRSILLALKPEVNQDVKLVTFATITDRDDLGRVVSTFDIRLPESRTQSLETRVVVKSGQTVVMGGVMERLQQTYVESVPVLGSIPIIGAAFRRRTEVDKPRYLLVFVTATLISENGDLIIFDETQETRN
jgi:type IV pilus assembly protein PilQ